MRVYFFTHKEVVRVQVEYRDILKDGIHPYAYNQKYTGKNGKCIIDNICISQGEAQAHKNKVKDLAGNSEESQLSLIVKQVAVLARLINMMMKQGAWILTFLLLI